MASWMVHLRVAESLLSKIANLSETEFIVGNIAPDSGVPNEDWSIFTPNTTVSHFKVKDENGEKAVSPEKYREKYFTNEKIRGYDQKQYSFYLGYFTHLMTDLLWVEKIVAASIEKDSEAYRKDRQQAIWKWKEDWYDLDFLYLREHPEFRAFAVYESAEGFENTYMDEFSPDAFDNRRKYITSFYREEKDNLDRVYPYLTKAEMDAFVAEAADCIAAAVAKLSAPKE